MRVGIDSESRLNFKMLVGFLSCSGVASQWKEECANLILRC